MVILGWTLEELQMFICTLSEYHLLNIWWSVIQWSSDARMISICWSSGDDMEIFIFLSTNIPSFTLELSILCWISDNHMLIIVWSFIYYDHTNLILLSSIHYLIIINWIYLHRLLIMWWLSDDYLVNICLVSDYHLMCCVICSIWWSLFDLVI